MDDPDELGADLVDRGLDLLGVEDLAPGRSIAVTCAPARSATSTIRPPKTPLTQTSILSPGSIRLTTTASIPAEPVPETAIVKRFSVRKTCRRSVCVSSIRATNSGSRCPNKGIPSAARTRGWTSLGPGPRSTRVEGLSGAGGSIGSDCLNDTATFLVPGRLKGRGLKDSRVGNPAGSINGPSRWTGVGSIDKPREGDIAEGRSETRCNLPTASRRPRTGPACPGSWYDTGSSRTLVDSPLDPHFTELPIRWPSATSLFPGSSETWA